MTIDHSADPSPPEPPAERRAAVRSRLEMISADAQDDVHRYEGKPFDGRTIAAYQAEQNAMIQALANTCLYLLAELEDVEKRTGVDR